MEQDDDRSGKADQLIAQPSVEFTRQTWWDAVLLLYTSQFKGQDLAAISLRTEDRLAMTQRVFADIRAALRASVHWASFLNIPRFFENTLDPSRRGTVQPSLFLSLLALGALVQSSELKGGAKGRARAIKLLDSAHSALQASLSSNWVDIGLVQAAWV